MIEPVTLLELVETLHEKGFQRIRIMPYMAPSGLYWRLQIYARGTDDTAKWSTADGEVPTADELLADHPGLAEHGRGEDPAYAAWVRRVLELARQGWVAYFFADYPTEGTEGVPLLGAEEGKPVLEKGKPVLEEPPGGR